LLQPEARWLRDRLQTLQPSDGPVLNVGSASAEFRCEVQPWIDAQVFAPLRARGVRVVHQDLQAADGVDLVGDLLSSDAVQAARRLGVRSVICSNVLEHVPDPHASACAPSHGQSQAPPLQSPHAYPPFASRDQGRPVELLRALQCCGADAPCVRQLRLLRLPKGRGQEGRRGLPAGRILIARRVSDLVPITRLSHR